MKLLWSSRSPFARKVLVAVHELGLQDRVELERVVVAARGTNPAVMQFNPLNQIPTLLLDDETALFDSPVIVEFLESTYGDGALIPVDPARRWTVLRLQALGDGLLSLNVLRLAERNRGEMAVPDYVEAFTTKTAATLDRLEIEVATLEPLSVGSIAVACGLGHLDFRFPDEPWRAGRPKLAAFQDAMETRPSMQATIPQEFY